MERSYGQSGVAVLMDRFVVGLVLRLRIVRVKMDVLVISMRVGMKM